MNVAILNADIRHVMTQPDYAFYRECIELILIGENHRDHVNAAIERSFLSESMAFFKEIVDAKSSSTSNDKDWYRETFLNDQRDMRLVAAYGGLSRKSIQNKRQTTRREVILEETLENYHSLLSTMTDLCDSNFDIDLKITFRDSTVNLDINESMIVINALAMRRNQIRGSNWSAFGKIIEYPLLKCMCELFKVPPTKYSRGNRQEPREIDFCLFDKEGKMQKCELKLMGSGNPEGADSPVARYSNVFIASKLSEANIQQLEQERVKWVELNKPFGFIRFGSILEDFGIQHSELCLSEDELIDRIKEVTNELIPEDFLKPVKGDQRNQ